MLEINKIHCGDNLNLIREIDDSSVSLVVTSPPYSSIRKYQGFEWDFQSLSHEIYRALIDGGVVCWIVNDQYINGGRDCKSWEQLLYFKNNCDFNVHDILIYHKSGFNFPANNRYHQVWEPVFILSKGKPKVFNPIIDRKNAYPGQKAHGIHRGHDENDFKDMSKIVKAKPAGEYGKRTNVWYVKVGGGHVTDDRFAHKHPAIFPDSLAGDLIKSFSNEGDLVLDVFNGSGATTKMARLLNRNFLGLEISQEYCDIANLRLKKMNESLCSQLQQNTNNINNLQIVN